MQKGNLKMGKALNQKVQRIIEMDRAGTPEIVLRGKDEAWRVCSEFRLSYIRGEERFRLSEYARPELRKLPDDPPLDVYWYEVGQEKLGELRQRVWQQVDSDSSIRASQFVARWLVFIRKSMTFASLERQTKYAYDLAMALDWVMHPHTQPDLAYF